MRARPLFPPFASIDANSPENLFDVIDRSSLGERERERESRGREGRTEAARETVELILLAATAVATFDTVVLVVVLVVVDDAR